MAPTIEDYDTSEDLSTTSSIFLRDTPQLYRHAEQKQMQSIAHTWLANFGVKFLRDVVVGSHALYIYNANGSKTLDWTYKQTSCLIRHGHPETVEVVHKHAAQLVHLFSGMRSPLVIDLTQRLTSLLPPDLDRALFLSTGGET